METSRVLSIVVLVRKTATLLRSQWQRCVGSLSKELLFGLVLGLDEALTFHVWIVQFAGTRRTAHALVF